MVQVGGVRITDTPEVLVLTRRSLHTPGSFSMGPGLVDARGRRLPQCTISKSSPPRRANKRRVEPPQGRQRPQLTSRHPRVVHSRGRLPLERLRLLPEDRLRPSEIRYVWAETDGYRPATVVTVVQTVVEEDDRTLLVTE